MRAAFPPGSVTGAPKIQALKVIADARGHPARGLHRRDRLREPGGRAGAQRRDPHAGGPGERAWLGRGGGIVADSDPARSCARRWARRRRSPARSAAACLPPARAAPAPPGLAPARPDPARGLLETIGVRDGRPGGRATPSRPAARERARALRRRLPDARTSPPRAPTAACAARSRPGRRVEVEETRPARRPRPSRSSRACWPAGSARHKWLDRRARSDLAGGRPRRQRARGRLGERVGAHSTARLVTPPDDGRLLPGVTRARMLGARTAAREAPLSLAELAGADAVVLTSSIRLATPAGRSVRRPTRGRRRELAADCGRSRSMGRKLARTFADSTKAPIARA